ncbi:type II and III secretion system protein family protein [Pleionea litopenaei]|uniref:Pilus assembly protein N-terminal domain-containing protein n=1 Tax=Pleionea litopenaei TaxID=3070815 RepID=A0AA51X7M0_9GAMM|nr:pilus assembly protein N-terminal domain-containing protein [Pleionea sp. HL-JVS1]WMS87250.1 pilus assembly protein N-terminal domain-containing protein [Pleionea sp. HL-JVS1]
MLRVIFFCLSVVLVATNIHAKSNRSLNLYVGSVKSIQVGEVIRVAVGRDDILATSILENGELLLVPRAPGETDLHIWKKGERKLSYRVNITQENISKNIQSIRSILSGFKSITVRSVNGIVVVDGKVQPERFDLLQGIVAQFPGVISLVTPEDVVLRDMIRMEVQVLELNKSFSRDLGLDWDNSIAGPSVSYVQNINPNGRYVFMNENNPFIELFDPSNPTISLDDKSSFSYSGLQTGITSVVRLLQDDGVARVLAEPSLSTRSGESATFQSGGQYPIAVLNEFGQPVVQMQDYGIQLEITPLSDADGNIISRVRAEMSTIDFATQVNGVPGILTRNTESVINLKNGETMVISGLLQSSDSKSIESLPFLGDIPILGELFKSRSFQENRTELVILVTPKIVDGDAELPEHLKQHLEKLRQVQKSTKIEDDLLE